MTDAYILREMVADEQREFAEVLRGLTPEQWASPSLCAKWSVHDAVIHIAKHVHTTGLERTTELARLKFSEYRQLDLERGRPTDDLIDWLASPAMLFGPTNILTQLSELVVHQQDVRRALGKPRAIPAARLSVVLDFGITMTGGISVANARRRAKGLRLAASDMPWTAGSGPEVRGPGEAIFMALNGRSAAVADLSGDGVETLAARLS